MIRRNFLRTVGTLFAFLTVDKALSQAHPQSSTLPSAKLDENLDYAFQVNTEASDVLKKKLRDLNSQYFNDGRIVRMKRISVKEDSTHSKKVKKVFTFKSPEDKAQYVVDKKLVMEELSNSKKLPIA